VEKIGVSNGA